MPLLVNCTTEEYVVCTAASEIDWVISNLRSVQDDGFARWAETDELLVFNSKRALCSHFGYDIRAKSRSTFRDISLGLVCTGIIRLSAIAGEPVC